MKTKNRNWYFTIILILSIILNLWLNVLNKKLTFDIKKYLRKIELLKETNEQLKANLLKSVFSKDYKLSPDLELYNTDGSLCRIDSILLFKPKLFFRYTKLNCNLCVGRQIQLLKTFIDTIGKENIIVLADLDQIRYISAFKRVNDLNCEILLLGRFDLDAQVNSLEAPYYFISSNNQEVKNIFIPIIDMPDLTRGYFSLVKNSFMKEK